MSNAELMKAVMDKFGSLDTSLLNSNPITLDKKFTDSIFAILKSEDDDEKKKNIIKIGSKRALKLNPKDVIIITHDKIVIKKFIPPKPKLSPAEKLTLFKKHMDKERLSEFLNALVEHLMSNELDFTRISNSYFMENYLEIIKTVTLQGLKSEFSDEDSQTLELYLAFIIKNYLNVIMLKISEFLVELLIEKNDDAVKYISYYDGDIEVDERNGKKYVKPIMVDENGSKWNSSNLLPVVIQHKKDGIALERKKESISKLEEEIEVLNSQISELSLEIKNLENLEEELTTNRDVAAKSVSKLQDELSRAKSSQNSTVDTSEISSKIKFLMKEEEKMFQEMNQANDELIKLRGIMSDLRNKKKLKDERLLDDVKKQKAIIKSQEVMKEKYRLVISALMLTLPKMRTPYGQ